MARRVLVEAIGPKMAVLRLCNPRANQLDMAFIEEISDKLMSLDKVTQ